MQKIVKVSYFSRETNEFTPMAQIVVEAEDAEHALEQAYFHTQNIEGSWSRGKTFEDGTPNGDFFAGTEVLVPLMEHDGRVYGHRSSMIGDAFAVDGELYICATFGFRKAPAPEKVVF